MDIKYLGHSSFLLKSKDCRLVTDPFDPGMTGIKFPKVEADVVTVSHQHGDHNQTKLIGGTPAPLVIDMPGEFEVKGMRIFGFASFHDKEKGAKRGENNLYKMEADGVSVLHCGDLGLVLDDNFIDTLGQVDVLLVPVGGVYTITAQEAVSLVKRVEPRIVIPMHYNHDKLKQEGFSQLSRIDEFLKEMGASNTVPVPKFSIKKEELNQEMKVVVMEITG